MEGFTFVLQVSALSFGAEIFFFLMKTKFSWQVIHCCFTGQIGSSLKSCLLWLSIQHSLLQFVMLMFQRAQFPWSPCEKQEEEALKENRWWVLFIFFL